MGKKQSSEPPPPVPTAGQNYKSFITEYADATPAREQTTIGDVNLAMQAAQTYLPQYLELQREFMPEMMALERQFAPDVQAMQNEQRARAAENNIALVGQYGDQFRGVAEDPQTVRIRAMLGQQLENELAQGAGLDDSLRREIEQSVRAAQSARGITRGSGPVAAESLIKGLQAEQLRRNRQSAAENFLKTQAATQPNAYSALTGQFAGPTSGTYAPPTPAMPGTANSAQMVSQGMGLQNQNAMMNNQLQYNYKQAQMAGQGGYGSTVGALAGGGLGFMVGGPMGAAVGAGLGGGAGSALPF